MAIVTNPDDSVNVWFGPTLPQGVNPPNWAQTVSGKGWNVPFRLYGPLLPWFDKQTRHTPILAANYAPKWGTQCSGIVAMQRVGHRPAIAIASTRRQQ